MKRRLCQGPLELFIGLVLFCRRGQVDWGWTGGWVGDLLYLFVIPALFMLLGRACVFHEDEDPEFCGGVDRLGYLFSLGSLESSPIFWASFCFWLFVIYVLHHYTKEAGHNG
ncbi:hypothetical protein QBC40DRAFT_276534 [Triangularia verruculosa]|uniref:Uncharacterized protein n=1 Tax=Triangularia verruculosa TaxID=2587418 RepID=A0AAN7AWR0_9PEZI|nr:hypothetical protein QBC40DRAFT_276534 [Triangularia verruculosa]